MKIHEGMHGDASHPHNILILHSPSIFVGIPRCWNRRTVFLKIHTRIVYNCCAFKRKLFHSFNLIFENTWVYDLQRFTPDYFSNALHETCCCIKPCNSCTHKFYFLIILKIISTYTITKCTQSLVPIHTICFVTKPIDRMIYLFVMSCTIALQVLGAHIVKGFDLSSSDFTEGKTFKTINNFTLTIRKFNKGIVPRNTVYIRLPVACFGISPSIYNDELPEKQAFQSKMRF